MHTRNKGRRQGFGGCVRGQQGFGVCVRGQGIHIFNRWVAGGGGAHICKSCATGGQGGGMHTHTHITRGSRVACMHTHTHHRGAAGGHACTHASQGGSRVACMHTRITRGNRVACMLTRITGWQQGGMHAHTHHRGATGWLEPVEGPAGLIKSEWVCAGKP